VWLQWVAALQRASASRPAFRLRLAQLLGIARRAEPAEITLSAACNMNFQQSAVVRAIFKRP
jgi:hypothetical protein